MIFKLTDCLELHGVYEGTDETVSLISWAFFLIVFGHPELALGSPGPVASLEEEEQVLSYLSEVNFYLRGGFVVLCGNFHDPNRGKELLDV